MHSHTVRGIGFSPRGFALTRAKIFADVFSSEARIRTPADLPAVECQSERWFDFTTVYALMVFTVFRLTPQGPLVLLLLLRVTIVSGSPFPKLPANFSNNHDPRLLVLPMVVLKRSSPVCCHRKGAPCSWGSPNRAIVKPLATLDASTVLDEMSEFLPLLCTHHVDHGCGWFISA